MPSTGSIDRAPVLVDTHCHLDLAYFAEGPDAVMARAAAVGVGGFVVIGVGASLDAARAAVALAHARPAAVAATVGVHPHDAAQQEDLERLAADPAVVAIGEIGLDFHYDHSPRATQRDVFARSIQLARQLKKPIVVHTRSAPAETLALLESESARDVGGVIHCFSEDWAFASRALDMDFDVSFSGILTFRNARPIQEVAARAPSDRILVETDSPYLSPVPHRGKPCEPAYIVHTAAKLAELRGVSVEEIRAVTTANATRRFRRSFSAGAGDRPLATS